MSYKTQVALGKNTTLQRQLEDRYVEFRRNLKSTRRRFDMLEEECLSVLYKLIIEQREKDEKEKQKGSDKKTASERAKSANAKMWRGQPCVGPPLKSSDSSEPSRRSATSMSVRDYKKSYSFQLDGLNIDKSRRDRYIRSKQQKQEKEIEIRRGNVHWATQDDFDERPKTTLPETETSDEKETTQVRPYTADPYQSRNTEAKLLQRSKLRNTLRPGTTAPATELNYTQTRHNSETEDRINDTREEIVMKKEGAGMHRLEDTPTQISTDDDRSADKNTAQIAFKVSVTKLNDMRGPTPNTPEHSETLRLHSRNDMGTAEDELIPLGEDDQRHLETIMTDNADADKDSVDGTTSRLDMSSRMTIQSGKLSRSANTPSGGDEKKLEELAAKTQGFLTSYAKKSKLLGYVVKNTTSSVAPRDKNKKMYRSHCVTYQELVSIKANIKQQESRTRLLLQRSAKLTKYVENLANAGNVRKYHQSLKNTS